MNAAAAIFLLVLVLFVAGFAVFVRRDRRARLARATARAEAEVLRVWRDGDGPYCVEYRFRPAGHGEAVTGVAYGGCLRAGLPEPGERIAVRYDPADPRSSHPVDGACAIPASHGT